MATMASSVQEFYDGKVPAEGLMVLAAYIRYSSELQDETSLLDQLTRCREAARRLGGYIPDELVFSDPAISGQSMTNRPGLQRLLRLSKEKPAPRFQGVLFDDTSRLARNLEELIHIYKVLKHRQVFLYFASTGLDSRVAGFDYGLTFSGMIDEQFIAKLREAIRRGMKGQISRGYTPGGPHYGYDHVPDEDKTQIGLYGRPKVRGVWRIKNKEEAENIHRVFQMRADGHAHGSIARGLDADAVPLPRDGKKRHIHSWSAAMVRGILLNDLYRGTVIWGRTENVKDPETRRIEARPRPKSEWVIEQWEDLRIISDELWAAAHKQSERFGQRGKESRGGSDRTQHSRGYIFSTQLGCGACAGSYVIASGKYPSARYGCWVHRDKGNAGCSNGVTISQASLETQFLTRIATTLQSPEFFEEIAREFNRQLSSAIAAGSALAVEGTQDGEKLEKELAALEKEISMLAEGFAKSGSDILLGNIKTRESRRVKIRGILAASKKPSLPNIESEAAKAFLKRQFESLVETLRADGETAKRQIAKLLDKKLVLTPETRNGEVVLVVTGDLRLFENDDAMLVKTVEGIDQHCIDLRLSLDGLVLHPYVAVNKRHTASRAEIVAPFPVTSAHVPYADAPTYAVSNLGEESEIDTVTVLAGAFSGDLNSDDADPEADAGTAPAEFEYRDGFGGLRLAAVWQAPHGGVTVGVGIA
jgi:site-specific DNA recombinase